jgi:hypothetical protein
MTANTALTAIPTTTSPAVTEVEDHGCVWRRIHAREIARFEDSGHLVIVVPMATGKTNEAFGFMVVVEETMVIKRTGTAPTRGEARRNGVIALAELVGLLAVKPVSTTTSAGEMPPALRTAATLVLIGIAWLAVVGIALGLASMVRP